ncbi:MAG TPA: NAD(P)H-dependent oxidoreductase subunit E [Atribacteraceae bacterium]|nr:NAD(P)H-dependent oxidoreductase subunit E [Atribacteraceae bacterium]
MNIATATHTQKSSRQFLRVDDILDRFHHNPAKLIAILQAVQEEYRYLPEPVLSYVATRIKIPRARVFGVATFYSHFSLKPKGKHIIKICDGTACHVNKSGHLLDLIHKKLGLSDKKRTTDDLLFTVEKVSCLGACGLAPVVVIDERVHPQVQTAHLTQLIDELMHEEE